ncbi:MAG: ferrous iron transport protein B [Negativicutes bacterium]|nr:ferrous iron transport protein B [Negativicutes bacterium]
MSDHFTFALVGNQNCGKTTLFNQLTGSNQHVGNFPGVTVEQKSGGIKGYKKTKVVDLPGIYSLSPYTTEEIVTRDFLLDEKPDCIINIADATNLERNLYLTLQLLDLQIPMVLALNMMDEVRASGHYIDFMQLSDALGIEVIPISAMKNQGVAELIDRMMETAAKKIKPRHLDFCSGELHKAIHAICHLIESKAEAAGVAVRFAAAKLVEGDELMEKRLALTPSELEILQRIVEEAEHNLGMDREAAVIDLRYQFIEQLCARTLKHPGQTKEQIRSEKIDRLLTHRYFGIPIFFLFMILIFWITFGPIGSYFVEIFALVIDGITGSFDARLTRFVVNPILHSLLIDGVFAGVGSVLGFLPIILILFFLLSILEDTGYMARVAFMMDQFMRKVGLSGRSIVPMLMGFGCSVPAIMATRTLPGDRDRKITMLLTPFLSCSAKVPIYAIFSAAFFPAQQALVMITLYLGGVLMAILSGFLLKSTVMKGDLMPFVLELPAYRLPNAKSVAFNLYEKAKDFMTRAFTVIFLGTIVIWFLQSFDLRFNWITDSNTSILAGFGRSLAPLFAPLGFADWRAATALLAGLTAKEAVVSTLAILTGVREVSQVSVALPQIFTPLSAFSFLVFTLLYSPCIAALSAVRREWGSWRGMVIAFLYQTGIAWLAAYFVFQVGSLIL